MTDRQCLGVSTHSTDEVRGAVEQGVDMLGFGPVFPSSTKQGHAGVTGPDCLAQAVRAARGVPVVAIGGIDETNAGVCAQAGASGVAVIGALARAKDPCQMARRISLAFERGKPGGAW
jgi:thiamine-phosphate pyrophosphorylase